MKKLLSLKFAITAIASIGAALALSALPVAAASAAVTHPAAIAVTSCSPCYVHTTNGHAPLWRSNGTFWGTLPLNDEVEVTCWYYGNPPSPWLADGYQDHVVWVNALGTFYGHIPDDYINFGGLYPPQVGLPQC